MNGPEFPTRTAAENHYRGYMAHTYTSRINGGKMEDATKLREWVQYKIDQREIRITHPERL